MIKNKSNVIKILNILNKSNVIKILFIIVLILFFLSESSVDFMRSIDDITVESNLFQIRLGIFTYIADNNKCPFEKSYYISETDIDDKSFLYHSDVYGKTKDKEGYVYNASCLNKGDYYFIKSCSNSPNHNCETTTIKLKGSDSFDGGRKAIEKN